jgi:peptidoglycan hydrolase-like protein with peptidoglycan-binding domain
MSFLGKVFDTAKTIKISGLPAPALKELQGLLKDAGYNIPVDSIFGPQTAKAFASFKASVFQDNPGLIGPASLELLRKEAIDRKTGKAPTEAVRPVSAQGNSTRAASNTAAIAPKDTGLTTKMLPSGDAVYVERPVIPGGSFTWAEFTKDGSRWPVDVYTEGNAIKLAQQLEHVRRLLNAPMVITSAYRPPAVNRAVGGAWASRHVHFDAVDFYCPSMSIGSVHAIVEPYWGNRGGCAVSYSGQFLHLDLRGFMARWVYG